MYCEQNAKNLNVQPVGTYSYHCALKAQLRSINCVVTPSSRYTTTQRWKAYRTLPIVTAVCAFKSLIFAHACLSLSCACAVGSYSRRGSNFSHPRCSAVVTIKAKFALKQATKAWFYSFFNFGARWGWVVNAMPRPIYPRERPGSHCVGGRVGPRAGQDGCGKSRPPERVPGS